MAPFELLARLDEMYAEGAISDDTRRHLRDRLTFMDVEARQTWQWIDATVDRCQTVAAEVEPAPDTVAIFWVRTAGTLIDLRGRLGATVADWTKMAAGRAGVLAHVAPLAGVVDALNDARAALADDEAFYLEYRRHVECHPLQDRYRLKIRKGRLDDKVSSRILGRSVTHAESERMLGGILRRHGINETWIAIELARRLAPKLAAVRERARPIYAPPVVRSGQGGQGGRGLP